MTGAICVRKHCYDATPLLLPSQKQQQQNQQQQMMVGTTNNNFLMPRYPGMNTSQLIPSSAQQNVHHLR